MKKIETITQEFNLKDLRTEQEIMQNWKGDQSQPMVSILCITYNHEKYLADAIEGFIIQQTDFPFEILIHDDASTDKTPDILRQYELNYPNLIKPIYQKENQYSKGNHPGELNKRRALGKYYALCEGDDYWNVPHKLQKQVEFLEKNNDFSLCFHDATIIYENNRMKPHSFFSSKKKPQKNEFSIDDIILLQWFIPTASMLFRSSCLTYPKWNKYIYNGDYAIQLLLADKGKFYGMEQRMSVYRRHSSNIADQYKYTGYDIQQKKVELLFYFNVETNFKYNNQIQSKIKALSVNYRYFLYNRPLRSKMLSVDFYYFKLISLLSRLHAFKNAGTSKSSSVKSETAR